MDRRHLLQALGAAWAATGLPVDALTALSPPAARRPGTAFFTAVQRAALDGMTEAIIPATDTPGAREARVVGFLEVLVPEWMNEAERRAFVLGLDRAVALARNEGVTDLADEAAWMPVLERLENEGDGTRESDLRVGSFFHRLRSLTLTGYYTSEPGMTVELYYRPRPGRWMGCVPLESVTRPVDEGLPGGGP